MNSPSASSPERFDRLRETHPDLAINLYAMEPGGLVTLEIITPDGTTYTFAGATAESAMLVAFPDTGQPTQDRHETDIFA